MKRIEREILCDSGASIYWQQELPAKVHKSKLERSGSDVLSQRTSRATGGIGTGGHFMEDLEVREYPRYVLVPVNPRFVGLGSTDSLYWDS